MSIEIKSKIVIEDDKEVNTNYLVIDGIVDDDSYASDHAAPDIYANLYNDDAIEAFINHSIKEIILTFSSIGYSLDLESWDEWIRIRIYNKAYLRENPFIRFDLQIQDWEHWAKPWSIADIAKQIESNVKLYADHGLEYWQDDDDSVLNGFGIDYIPSDLSLTLNEEFDEILPVITDIINESNKRVLASLDNDAVLTYFKFPE
jgi:hypothetical protein